MLHSQWRSHFCQLNQFEIFSRSDIIIENLGKAEHSGKGKGNWLQMSLGQVEPFFMSWYILPYTHTHRDTDTQTDTQTHAHCSLEVYALLTVKSTHAPDSALKQALLWHLLILL